MCWVKFGKHTAELFLEEDLEVVSASQVAQQLEKAEGPALYSHLSGDINSGHKHSDSSHTAHGRDFSIHICFLQPAIWCIHYADPSVWSYVCVI